MTKKVTELPAATTPLGASDILLVVQGGVSKQSPVSGLPSSGAGIDVYNDGVPVSTASTLNFTGDGVLVADAGGGTVDISIGGGGSADIGLIDLRYSQTVLPELLEDSSHSDNLGNFSTGVNEFSLIYHGGSYHLFYDDLTGTAYRTASSLAGLAGASATALFSGERYPSAFFDGTTWHVFTNVSNSSKKHYTSSSPGSGYTVADTMPGFPTNANDVDVQFNPQDGQYYCAYKNMGANLPCGVAKSSSLSGPWTDLGLVFTNRGTWHAQEEADGHCVFVGNRSYVMFAGWDGTTQRPGIVEVDPDTMKALGPAFCIVEPFEDWHKPVGGRQRLFNPVWFDDDGEAKVIYAVNAGSGAAGWGSIKPRFTRNPRRLPSTLIFGFNNGTLSDDATSIVMTPHGAYNNYPDRAVFTSATGGFYGNTAFTSLDDFTLIAHVVFSNVASGGFQRVCSFEISTSVGHTLGLWLNSSGQVYIELQGASGDPGNFTGAGTNVLTANASYKIVVRRQGSKLRVYINGALEISATCSVIPSGISGFRVANSKNATQLAGQQLEGTIYKLHLFREALPSRQW